jgi:FkbM family methyltransferase
VDKLVFDIGMHHGRDTEFYLAKGFRVVAVEANTALAEAALKRFSEQVAAGRLAIEHKALSDQPGLVSFYVNDDKDDWSSLTEDFAARQGTHFRRIEVAGVTLGQLIERHGVPYYLKIDVEGADTLCLRQLSQTDARPAFVSFEAEVGHPERLSEQMGLVERMGYNRFQVINQRLHKRTRPPNPPVEGDYCPRRFDGFCSGLFGMELPDCWLAPDGFHKRLDFLNRWNVNPGDHDDESCSRLSSKLRLVRAVLQMAVGLPMGWYDVHATTAGQISASGRAAC